ncbi:MAG: hypothetical protein IJJ82_02210 [Clostridia bacterium]|nr:hypothetical protein [Clostridia bacterium]
MFKNIQSKIILIMLLCGLIIITGIGVRNIMLLNDLANNSAELTRKD